MLCMFFHSLLCIILNFEEISLSSAKFSRKMPQICPSKFGLGIVRPRKILQIFRDKALQLGLPRSGYNRRIFAEQSQEKSCANVTH